MTPCVGLLPPLRLGNIELKKRVFSSGQITMPLDESLQALMSATRNRSEIAIDVLPDGQQQINSLYPNSKFLSFRTGGAGAGRDVHAVIRDSSWLCRTI